MSFRGSRREINSLSFSISMRRVCACLFARCWLRLSSYTLGECEWNDESDKESDPKNYEHMCVA